MHADAMRGDGLAIAPHIRLCPIDDQVIVLDLLNNRYAGLAGASFAALSSVLGWPSPGQMPMFKPDRSDAAALIAPLRARGWLVETSTPSATLPIGAALPAASQTLLPSRSANRSVLGSVRALRCLRSALSASWCLRHRSLFAIANTVAQRQEGLRLHGDASSRDEHVDAVSTYLRVRPLLFSARDRCLHDSLTLVTFLAAERIRARWVIGVRIRPFAAHSWVQHEHLVLNDQHERVRSYRPIFVA
jgi:hypothetical protein